VKDTIPFVDLHAQYLTIKDEIDAAIADVVNQSLFIRGPYVEKFEVMFAEAVNAKYCVSCANGTDALYIAMASLGIKPGDEVIAPAHSWISTTETITQAGGKVIFCDTDTDTFTIDVEHIESKVTDKTVGVVPVHLYGQPADMDPIMDIAQKHGLWVVEDCAQAHMARYNGRLVGTIGDVGCFSFYPGKNLGAMGDAGCVVTNNVNLANKMTKFARHGGLRKGEHEIEGINSRLDGIQAAILSVKLPHLNKWIERRQYVANQYAEMLSTVDLLELPKTALGREHVWHLYVVRSDYRDQLESFLNNESIQTGINYRIALPFLEAYKRYGHQPKDFPNAYKNQSRILSIPIYPEMEVGQIERVTSSIETFFEGV
jgi:dTDP-4-amino-4,6-dideoxygalactose transaminase